MVSHHGNGPHKTLRRKLLHAGRQSPLPSGVSYVLENRELLKRTFPKVFDAVEIMPISDYGLHLLDTLQYLLSDRTVNPKVVLLTPGIYNSAYFEHSFLAKEMGIELVEGRGSRCSR